MNIHAGTLIGVGLGSSLIAAGSAIHGHGEGASLRLDSASLLAGGLLFAGIGLATKQPELVALGMAAPIGLALGHTSQALVDVQRGVDSTR